MRRTSSAGQWPGWHNNTRLSFLSQRSVPFQPLRRVARPARFSRNFGWRTVQESSPCSTLAFRPIKGQQCRGSEKLLRRWSKRRRESAKCSPIQRNRRCKIREIQYSYPKWDDHRPLIVHLKWWHSGNEGVTLHWNGMLKCLIKWLENIYGDFFELRWVPVVVAGGGWWVNIYFR